MKLSVYRYAMVTKVDRQLSCFLSLWFSPGNGTSWKIATTLHSKDASSETIVI